MSVEFRYAAGDEYPAISRFLNDYWAKDHVYCRSRALFDWTFQRPGHWPGGQYSVALAEDKGELVGILGGIPFAFNRFGERSRGVLIVYFVVRPDYRRGPTALRLLGRFRRPEFSACVAFGITRASAAIYRVLRGEVLPPAPRSFVVLPGNTGRMADLLRAARPDWPAERARALAERFELAALPGEAVDWSDELPGDWDRAGWLPIAASTAGAARDSDYLEWRYLRHPVFDYRVIAVREGDRKSVV